MPLFVTKPAAEKTSAPVLGAATLGGKAIMEKRTARLRHKNQSKAYTYLVTAFVILGLYSFAFLYPQVTTFINANTQLSQLQEEARNLDSSVVPNLTAQRDTLKAAYDAELNEAETIVERIFPGDVDRVGIARRLENFAVSVSAIEPPFELNSLSFGEPEVKDGYTILPVSLSTHSSRANFERFLQLISLSGRMDSDVHVRLMEISNMTIRYRGVDAQTGKDQGVDFSVKLNAYSR